MDGPQLATAIRNLPVGREVPLVLLTGLQWRPQPEQRALFAAAVAKPLKATVLRGTLVTALADIPAARVPTTPTGGRRHHDGPADNAAPLRALLAEDNPINQRVAQLLLGKLGCRVDTVSNGVEAVEAVRHATYDVVLMDIEMPEMDGLPTRTIRAELPPDRQPCIVALTAGAMVESRRACLEAGMDDYLAKPARPQELSAALMRAVA